MSLFEPNTEHFSECKEDTELELNNQGPQESDGNLQTWINAKNDPFILKFPPEISSYIFCLSMDASSYKLSKKLPTSFLLGSVCHGWRLLAHSTPELWSILSFTLAKPTKPAGISELQAVGDWLKLSGALPLTLRIFHYAGPNCFSQADPVINILNQHSGRWHALLLRLPAPLFGRFCGTSSPSILYDLYIRRYFYHHEIDGGPPTFKMHSRPSPTHLNIWCSLSPISAFDIAWDNLTSLKLALSIFDGCIEVILKAHNLEFCSLELICPGPFQDLPIPKTIARHTHLRTLELIRFSAILHRFLDGLELPSLETYYYQASLGDLQVEPTMDAMISLLNRSRAYLKQLTFIIDGPCQRSLKLLNASPCLQHLHLDFCYLCSTSVVHDLFERLSSSPPLLEGDVPGFLPDLQSLTIFAHGISMWACIPRLFSWPHRKFLHLQVNKLDDGIEIDNVTLRKILRLVDDGARIRILGGRDQWTRDHLQQFKESSHEAGLSQVLNVIDHAVEGESALGSQLVPANNGFSFSSCISCLFCGR